MKKKDFKTNNSESNDDENDIKIGRAIYLQKKTWESIKKIAKEEGESVSSLVRKLLREKIANEKK